jgi:RNA-binding protein
MNKSIKQNLKAQAHHLNPVVIIGSKGLTSAVIEETNLALQAHELIKVKVNGAEKNERKDIAASLCNSLQADFIQLIGCIAIIYRKNEEASA